jgi:hypothetical protein
LDAIFEPHQNAIVHLSHVKMPWSVQTILIALALFVAEQMFPHGQLAPSVLPLFRSDWLPTVVESINRSSRVFTSD